MKALKAGLLLALLVALALQSACSQPAPASPSAPTAPSAPSATQAAAAQPTAPPAPTATQAATLNGIQAAIATQSAQRTAVVVQRPTPRPMPPDSLQVSSPDGKNVLQFGLLDGAPYYSLSRSGQPVILPSRLGFTFLRDPALEGGLSVADVKTSSFDETWTQPWGEVKEIRDQHNELRVTLADARPTPRQMVVVFRVFNDGLGFRYELPEQPGLGEFQIMNELTEFAMPADHQAWWIGALLPNRYEYLYRKSPLSALTNTPVHTPLTMQTAGGLYLSIHEAALVNYASMILRADQNLVLHADLAPWSDGIKVKGKTPLKTPWRTIQVAEKPGDLITSYLILNLNDPNVLGDVSWVKPAKYIGIWWGMHLGKWTWGSGPLHGATTANTRQYLDFAAQNGFAGVLVEGWNLGWDGSWTANGAAFDFTTPYPDFDLRGLASYAASLGVKLIGHNETAAAVSNYEAQLNDAFSLYQSLGINMVKTGYVSSDPGVPRYDSQGNLAGMEYHHGQFMVQHYQKVVEAAAQYQIMLDVHEPIKDTGLRRTYPNMMTREGARGQEYNAWDAQGGNPPDYVTILPFTRLLAGPMDYTPGILGLTFPQYRPGNRVNHTVAKELALYVIIYSPLQMAADLIENYQGNPAFQFIRDVPADWQETRVLDAQIGDYITTVRQQRDGPEWFLGSVTDENARNLSAALDFLTPGVTYVAQIYADGAGADWKNNPYPLDIQTYLVDAATVLKLNLAAGGGQAVRFYPASAQEQQGLEKYQP